MTATVASIAVISLTLTGCAAAETTTPGGVGPGSTASSVESVVSNSDAAAIAASATASNDTVVALANAFAATLDDDQLADLEQEYSLANAALWSNLPQALLRDGEARIGLQLATLNEEQLAALDALLLAATGTGADEGWSELQQAWDADDHLAVNGGGTTYGRGNYYIAFLGTPGDSGTWELQFGGHHFALSNTYTDAALVGATPSFRGVEPFGSFDENDTTSQPLESEQAAFAALVGSLSDEQAAAAKLDDEYTDILLGPADDWAFPNEKQGIAASELSDDQKALVLAAIATYVDDIDDESAPAIMAKYESELDETYVSFSGSTDVTEENDYVRIDGPSVWIEFSMQHGIVLDGNHPHSVWRDRTTDYGGAQS
jgi:hypothetical protein